MKFGEWCETHKGNSDKWYIGMRAGWLFYGTPKDAPHAVQEIVERYYLYSLQRYDEGFRNLRDCQRYTSHADENIRSIKVVIEELHPDTLKGYETLKTAKTLLEMNLRTLSNIQRTLTNVKESMQEPLQPPAVRDIEIKEEYISCKGDRCLVLKGKVPGKFWDLEEAKRNSCL